MRFWTWKKIGMQVLWAVLAFLIVAHVRLIATMLLHPFGGHEFHYIFAYSHGNIGVAVRVLCEYILSSSLAASQLILCRWPGDWRITALVACHIVWHSWWQICIFPYQSRTSHLICLALLPLAAVGPLILPAAAHFLMARRAHTIPP